MKVNVRAKRALGAKAAEPKSRPGNNNQCTRSLSLLVKLSETSSLCEKESRASSLKRRGELIRASCSRRIVGAEGCIYKKVPRARKVGGAHEELMKGCEVYVRKLNYA